ncbi:MAG: FadR family transcriptional regulator [Trueperaceae bacterium]|nr:MAG: FadR family transcriptional regulator [Trueperaceae bacterium]
MKTYILNNNLRPGDPLPSEAELSRRLDVSRNSVREAVKVLESQGVIEIRRGTGLFVHQFSFGSLLERMQYGVLFDLADLIELIEVRRVLEHGVIEVGLPEMTQTQAERLGEVVAQMRARQERGEIFLEEDRTFHNLLFESLGNRTLLELIDSFWLTYSKAAESRGDLTHPDLSHIVDNHQVILDAILTRDKQGAHEAVDHHYDVAKGFLLQARREAATGSG